MDNTSSWSFDDCVKGNYLGFIFFYLTAALCFLIGTPAHLWCVWFYFGTERKIKDAQVFLLNHTIMELIYCLECLLELLHVYIFTNDIIPSALFFFFGLSYTGRPLLQIFICIEQYMAVLHPVTFLKYRGIKYRIAATLPAWLMAIAYGVYEIYTLVFPDIFYTSVFILALVVISFCCVSVLCALKQPAPGDTQNTKQLKINGGNQQKRNAFNTIFSALLLILFAYLPQILLVIVNSTGIDELLFHCTVGPLMTSLNVLGVIITPLLKLYKESHQNCPKH